MDWLERITERFGVEPVEKPPEDISPVSVEKEETIDPALLESVILRVRSDSKDKTSLTSSEVFPELQSEPAKTRLLLLSLSNSPEYEDIKSITGIDGKILFYSNLSLSTLEAERLASAEEIRSRIVAAVREESTKKLELTPVNSLGRLIPGAEPEKIDSHLTVLLDDERYRDIQIITNSKGARFLYSTQSITATYAGVLARARANDPLAAIAATVREESRIYPRPTNVQVFAAPVFNIDAAELEHYANQMLERPEYQDIKSIRASTGALYLYSETYLSRAFAAATMEWEEVGRYQNP